MSEMRELDPEMLANVTGGTTGETYKLILMLAAKGYGSCITDDLQVDFDRITSIFAAKGYTFMPSENGQNYFSKDGIWYGQDYIEYQLQHGEL